MALYRTYRPASFAEVVGQDHVTEPLGRALDTGRINHAYLFSGPRGCGKTSSARILARSLNCEQGPTSTPCGVCDSCVALAPGGPGNLDVIELDAASHGGVDDTRELRDRAFFAPAQSRYRVFIVDEAHMVTNAGFNALLKIVEEPPEHLIFVFATTEPEKVLPTIRSRTHHYPFRLLAPPVMRGLLERICEREGVTVAPEVYPLVIRAGGGSPRDSLSILDQLLAGAGDDGVTYERALSLLGVTDVALIDDAVDALAAGDGATLFGTVEAVVDAGHDPRRFAVDLLERLRDLILLQAVPEAVERGLVEAPGDQLERMRAQIEGLGPAMLTRAAETVHAALGEMRGTTSPRLLLEVMCARLLLPQTSADDAALLTRIERLEAGIPAGAASAAAGTPTESASPSRGAAATAATVPAPAPPPDDTPLKFTRPSQRKEDPAPSTDPESAPRRSSTGEAQAESVYRDPEPETVVTEPEAVVAEPESQPGDSAGTGLDTVPRPGARIHSTTESAVDDLPAEPESESALDDLPPEPEPESAVDDVPAAPESESALDDLPTEPESESAVDDLPPEAEPEAAVDDLPTEPESEAALDDLPSEPEPEPESEPAAASGLSLDDVQRRFGEVRAAVRAHSTVFESMLSSAFVHDVSQGLVTLGHPYEGVVGRLSEERAASVFRAALATVFGQQLDVRTIHVAPSAPTAGAQTNQAAARRTTPAYQRPSRGGPSAPPSDDDLPPEPEEPSPPPPRADEEIPDDERDEMVAQAHDQSDASSTEIRDPHDVALEVLQEKLGIQIVEE